MSQSFSSSSSSFVVVVLRRRFLRDQQTEDDDEEEEGWDTTLNRYESVCIPLKRGAFELGDGRFDISALLQAPLAWMQVKSLAAI
jgi:hypothetical protein